MSSSWARRRQRWRTKTSSIQPPPCPLDPSPHKGPQKTVRTAKLEHQVPLLHPGGGRDRQLRVRSLRPKGESLTSPASSPGLCDFTSSYNSTLPSGPTDKPRCLVSAQAGVPAWTPHFTLWPLIPRTLSHILQTHRSISFPPLLHPSRQPCAHREKLLIYKFVSSLTMNSSVVRGLCPAQHLGHNEWPHVSMNSIQKNRAS